MHHRLEPEDQARADIYALLGRLFAGPPDRALLKAISEAGPMDLDSGEAPLARAWATLVAASAAMDPEAAAQEYTELFVGVGRSEVDLHASHWIPEAMSEKPLVQVREDLARLGLGRLPEVSTYEDHLAALFEVMRVLVAGQDERRPSPVAEQRAFFERHLQPWVYRCCDAIRDSPIANYYRRVAEFDSLFMALERDSFAIE